MRPEHLQMLYNEKHKAGLSTKRIKDIHVILHSALNQAIKNGLIVRNVSEATTLPKKHQRKGNESFDNRRTEKISAGT